MIYVTGANLFGQWFCDPLILSEFLALNESKYELGIDINQIKIRHINWSYNILQISNTLYVSGAWRNKEKQLVQINLPLGCDFSDISELKVVGNDSNILLVNKETIWVFDLDMKSAIKKINLNIESPIEDIAKKHKIDLFITKVVIANDACLYLTINGYVYSGIFPNFIETKHCMGKVCDVQCGYEHFVLLTDLGRVYTWGNGRRLQLGHEDVCNSETPTEVEALAGIKIIKIVAGGWHTLALSEFGDLYAWGWNDTGQLGISSKQIEYSNKALDKSDESLEKLNKETEIIANQKTTFHKESLQSYSIPTLVDILDDDGYEVTKNVVDFACGSRHSFILLEDGYVWATGCNKYGQLGLSQEKYPSINCFKRVFHLDTNCSLMSGPWASVIIVK